MAAKTIIKGRDLMMFNDDGHAYAYATNHVFTMSAETSDISSKDHGIYGASEVSKITWELTTENLYTVEDYDVLNTAMLAGQPVTVRFGLKAPQAGDLVPADGSTALPYWTAGTTYYTGQAIITSLVANAPNGEDATFNATFTGVGSISKVAPNVGG